MGDCRALPLPFMKLTFWGAAGAVTGSMHLLETGGKRILLDCGMNQGKRKEFHDRGQTGKDNHRAPHFTG